MPKEINKAVVENQFEKIFIGGKCPIIILQKIYIDKTRVKPIINKGRKWDLSPNFLAIVNCKINDNNGKNNIRIADIKIIFST